VLPVLKITSPGDAFVEDDYFMFTRC